MEANRPIIWISSHVADGRVGNSIGVFALQRLGIDVVAVPTVLFPAVPGPGAPPGSPVPAHIFEQMLSGLLQSKTPKRAAGVHVGYLRSVDHARTIETFIDRARSQNPDLIFSLDPVFGDNGSLYVPEPVATQIKDSLAKSADILFPNRFELEFLSGLTLLNETQAIAAARQLNRPTVIASSLPGNTPDRLVTLCVSNTKIVRAETKHLTNAPNGTGDLQSALFLAHYIQNKDELGALEHSVNAVFELIKRAQATDRGLPIVKDQEILVTPPKNASISQRMLIGN